MTPLAEPIGDPDSHRRFEVIASGNRKNEAEQQHTLARGIDRRCRDERWFRCFGNFGALVVAAVGTGSEAAPCSIVACGMRDFAKYHAISVNTITSASTHRTFIDSQGNDNSTGSFAIVIDGCVRSRQEPEGEYCGERQCRRDDPFHGISRVIC
jgi:hypothetical protein